MDDHDADQLCIPDLDVVAKKQFRNLPHWSAPGAIYHVVFRLADSLPAITRQQLQFLRDRGELIDSGLDELLDKGLGGCVLKRPEAAQIVNDALFQWADDRYLLHACCIMPNHVHLVPQPLPGCALPGIVQGLKSITSRRISALEGTTGPVWRREYYDHIIRDESEYHRVVTYVRENPVRAGLKDWEWTYDRRLAN